MPSDRHPNPSRRERLALATAGKPRASSAERTFLSNGGQRRLGLPAGFKVDFAGEGEWKITLDVFRDLGLAFGAAMIAIYVLLVAQTRLVRHPAGRHARDPIDGPRRHAGLLAAQCPDRPPGGRFLDPVYFTATGMIGMIALAGIVTRDSIILVDFIHLSLARGRSLVRRDHGEPRGASAANPADRLRRDARRGADHH